MYRYEYLLAIIESQTKYSYNYLLDEISKNLKLNNFSVCSIVTPYIEIIIKKSIIFIESKQ